jgi:hypothetical protein
MNSRVRNSRAAHSREACGGGALHRRAGADDGPYTDESLLKHPLNNKKRMVIMMTKLTPPHPHAHTHTHTTELKRMKNLKTLERRVWGDKEDAMASEREFWKDQTQSRWLRDVQAPETKQVMGSRQFAYRSLPVIRSTICVFIRSYTVCDDCQLTVCYPLFRCWSPNYAGRRDQALGRRQARCRRRLGRRRRRPRRDVAQQQERKDW